MTWARVISRAEQMNGMPARQFATAACTMSELLPTPDRAPTTTTSPERMPPVKPSSDPRPKLIPDSVGLVRLSSSSSSLGAGNCSPEGHRAPVCPPGCLLGRLVSRPMISVGGGSLVYRPHKGAFCQPCKAPEVRFLADDRDVAIQVQLAGHPFPSRKPRRGAADRFPMLPVLQLLYERCNVNSEALVIQ